MTADEKKTYYHDGTAAFFARLGITPKYASLPGQGKLKPRQPVTQ
jgi:hypothetical protein